MISNQLPLAKNLKIKSFLLRIPVEMLIILLLYPEIVKSIAKPSVANGIGTRTDIAYNSEVISIASTMPPEVNRTLIKMTNVSYDLEYSKNLSNIYRTAQKKSLNDLNNQQINFTVDTINATSIQITITTLKHIPDPESLHDNGKSYRLMYNISYKLRTAELLLLKISDHCFKVPMKNHDDINTCKSSIYYFGHYSDTSDKDYDYLFDHCKLQSLIRPINKTSSSTIAVINNLLPSRYYEFNVSPYLVQSGENPNTIPIIYSSTDPKHNCTKEDIPVYPPQTDLGSFEVMLPAKYEEDRKHHDRPIRRVKLYWRPVPILFEGHNISTHLRCHEHDTEKVFYEKTFRRDEDIGFYSFELSEVRRMHQDSNYTCIIQSKNSRGYSRDSSIIKIPEQHQIIDTRGGFKIYAVAAVGGDYLVKWTDIQEIAPELIKSNLTIEKGVYTVYWCKEENCELGLEAMMKFAVDDNYNLGSPKLIHIPGSVTTNASENRRFGISFRSWKNKRFTGIHWSTCIGRVVYAHEPFEKLATHYIYSDRISFNWDVHGGCLALLTLFDEFHINYCELESVDPCLAPGTTEDIVGSFNYENNPSCFNLWVKNNLTTDATITNLKSATEYVLRIRAVIHGKKGENKWSDNLVFRTHPESHQCKKVSPALILIMIIVFILASLIFFYCRKPIRHYKSILKLYKRTNVKLPQGFDDPCHKNDDCSDIGLKYWFSQELHGAELQVESSMNINELDNENNQILGALVDNFFSDEDNQSEPTEKTSSSVPDYVDPSLMLTSQPTQSNQDSTQDNLTESLSRERDTISDIDEISITSHSSFLENILNEDS